MDWNRTQSGPYVRFEAFQYPLRVEMDWNLLREAAASLHSWFQYPLRVEMDWNALMRNKHAKPMRRFSTLCGSKWIGTIQEQCRSESQHQFQYPLRVEMDWNTIASASARAVAGVSVPSAGRNGLEQNGMSVLINGSICFSTLCGSKWIGTGPKFRAHADRGCFSTLCGSKCIGTRKRLAISHRQQGCFSTLCGSKWIGTVPARCQQFTRNGFSTLCGSKWIGTTLVLASDGSLLGFSTLCGSKWIGTLPLPRSPLR